MSQEMILIVPRHDIGKLADLLHHGQGVQRGVPITSAFHTAQRVFLPNGYHPDTFVDAVRVLSPQTAVYGGIIPQDDMRAYNGLSPTLLAWNLDKLAEERMAGESGHDGYLSSGSLVTSDSVGATHARDPHTVNYQHVLGDESPAYR